MKCNKYIKRKELIMEFKIGTTVYGVSVNYTNKSIRKGKINKITEHSYTNSPDYQIIMTTKDGEEYAMKAYINSSKTMLGNTNYAFFVSEDDAIMYHNMLVEDYIEEIRNKYTIRKDK